MRQRGFTLIEVVVALAILSIAVVTVLQAFSGSMRGVNISREYVDAVSEAQAAMRRALSDEEMKNGGWSEKTENGYDLVVNIDKNGTSGMDELKYELYDVKVTISWWSGLRQRSYSISTMKLQRKPDWT